MTATPSAASRSIRSIGWMRRGRGGFDVAASGGLLWSKSPEWYTLLRSLLRTFAEKETVLSLTHDQIDHFTEDFRRFARDKLNDGGAETVQDLVDLWRIENPTPAEESESLASIQSGIDDADAGRTVSVEQAFAEARKAVARRK